jgi:hypothetical protein
MDLLAAKVLTIEHIPKALRPKVSNVLKHALDLAKTGDIGNLLALAKLILCVPISLGKKTANKTATGRRNAAFAPDQSLMHKYTLRRVELYEKGEFQALWDSMPRRRHGEDDSKERPNVNGTPVAGSLEATIIESIADGNAGKAMKLLTSLGKSPYCVETEMALRGLHPPGAAIDVPEGLPAPLKVTIETLRRNVKSFARRTSPGNSGLRPEHLVELTTGGLFENRAAGEQPPRGCDHSLLAFVNVLLSGSLPKELAPYLAGATLIALRKKDGGVTPRPIAIGEVVRRLAAKCAMEAAKPGALEYFDSLQVGIGTQYAAEAIGRASTLYWKKHCRNPDIVQVDIDFANAFNSINRRHCLEQTRIHAPSIARFAYWCYGQPVHLFYGDKVIASAQGVQQGDPIGGLLFALGLHTVIREVLQ